MIFFFFWLAYVGVNQYIYSDGAVNFRDVKLSSGVDGIRPRCLASAIYEDSHIRMQPILLFVQIPRRFGSFVSVFNFAVLAEPLGALVSGMTVYHVL